MTTTIDRIPAGAGQSGVMIATNGGPGAVVTMRFGLALAAHRNVPATIVTVGPSDVEKVKQRLLCATGPGQTVPVYLVRGAIGPAIAEAADTWGAALVVIGLGIGDHHIAAAIVQSINRCVLAVSPYERGGTFERVMLTADFGGSSIVANRCALSLLADDGKAQLVHVTPNPGLPSETHAAWSRGYSGAVSELLACTRAEFPANRRSTIPHRIVVGDAAQALLDLDPSPLASRTRPILRLATTSARPVGAMRTWSQCSW